MKSTFQDEDFLQFPMHDFTVLILPADLFSIPSLRHYVELVHPGARCLLATGVQQARLILLSKGIDLFLTGLDAPDGDVLDLLLTCADEPKRAPQTLIVARHHQSRLLASLRSLRVDCVFDTASEPAERIVDALRLIETGGGYWSESLRAHLLDSRARTLLAQLTPTEQLAFALLGDGCADKVGAERLGMTLSATRALRRDLHIKLGAHDRADLIRLAVQHGFVRITSEGIVPLGLELLRREYRANCKRPIESAPSRWSGISTAA